MLLRRFILAILYSIFSTALLFFAIFLGIQQVLGSPTKLESALANSGIYTSAVTDTLSSNAQQTLGNTNIPLTNTDVQSAVKGAFPSSLLQNSTEQFLNGIYAWLQGKSSTPTFSIDLSGAKGNLADNLANYVQNRLDSLPTCTLATMPSNLSSVDVYTATCVPPGFNKATAVEQVRQDVQQSDFLKDPVLTADSIKSSNGQTLTQRLKSVQTLYHDLVLLLYALPGVIILTALGIIFVSRSRRLGIRHTAVTTLSTGIMTAIIAFFAVFVLDKITTALTHGSSASQPLQVKVLHIFDSLGSDLRVWWVGVGIAYTVAGLVTLIVLRIVRPKAPKLAALPYQQLPEDTPIGTRIAPTGASDTAATKDESGNRDHTSGVL